ncbi:MAG: O-antigen polymerase [Aquabacterium sp.]
MNTLLFLVAVIASLRTLLKLDEGDDRTLFTPGILIILLLSFCYLLPSLVLVGGALLGDGSDITFPERISVYGICFVLAFTGAYAFLASRLPVMTAEVGGGRLLMGERRAFWGFLLVFVVIKGTLKFYGVGDSDEYSDQYLVRRTMPQSVNQMISVLVGAQWMFIYAALASFYNGDKTLKSFNVVFGIGALLFIDMLFTHSRSVFVTYTFVAFAAYCLYRKPLGLWKELLLVTPFFVGMGLFSFLRVDGPVQVGWLQLLIPGEFVSIYSNALHMVRVEGTPDFVPPPGLSYIEAFLVFLPKQIYAGKWSLSEWYVNEYFPAVAEAGGGLAFGVIPEAVVNWGVPSIIFQGAFLGLVFRFAYASAKAARGNPRRGVVILFYLYCFSLCYQVIRSHSFALANGWFVGFLLPVLLLREIALFRRPLTQR